MKKIIIGLGNPGKEYERTRHNAGFMFLDFLRDSLSLPAFSHNKKLSAEVSASPEMILAKPQTFMNLSGEAVKKILLYYADKSEASSLGPTTLKHLFVVHDDLDLEVGQYKIQQGVGPKQHNGLLSIYQALNEENFWHIRIGIDDRGGSRLWPPEKYVLQKLPEEQLVSLQKVFKKISGEMFED